MPPTAVTALHGDRPLDQPPGGHVCAATTLRRLCASLATRPSRPPGHHLTLDVGATAENLQVRAVVARSLALVVAELVVNAAEQRLPTAANSQVTIELVRRGATIACAVRDDGGGALPARDGAVSRRMRQADTLAAQAGGRCRWLFTRAGTEAEVLLPLHATPPEPARIGHSGGLRALWRALTA